MLPVGLELRNGIKVSVAVADVNKTGVLVISPGRAVVGDPESAIGSNESVGGTFDFDGKRELFDSSEVFVFVKAGPFNEGAIPVPKE